MIEMIRPCRVGTCKLGPICQRPCVSEALGYRNVVLTKAPKNFPKKKEGTQKRSEFAPESSQRCYTVSVM